MSEWLTKTDTTPVKWRVLLLDDDPDVADLCAALLEGLSFRGREVELEWCQSAEVALQRWQEVAPALAIIDMDLSQAQSGADFIRNLRALDHTWMTRIILTTARTELITEWEATHSLELDGFLPKSSWTQDHLRSVVYSALHAFDLIARLESGRRSMLEAARELMQLDADQVLTQRVDAIVTSLLQSSDALRNSDKDVWTWGS
jgi:CheY-like chemotaxis protein